MKHKIALLPVVLSFAAAAILLPTTSAHALSLLIHSDFESSADDVKAKIDGAGILSAPVDVFVARTVTPSAALLSTYDSVLVWSNMTFSSTTLLGDRLADYVDAGGGVVVATAANAISFISPAGRWASDLYQPIAPLGSITTSSLTLGAAAIPDHPILTGVNSFNGGGLGLRSTGGLTSEASLISSWSNGDPLIAEKTGFNGPVVSLNFFPPSSDARFDFWNASTDGDLILANALAYAAGDLIPEPSRALLTLLGLGCVLVRRRR